MYTLYILFFLLVHYLRMKQHYENYIKTHELEKYTNSYENLTIYTPEPNPF